MLNKILLAALSLGSLSAQASEAWFAPLGRSLRAKPGHEKTGSARPELIDLLKHAEIEGQGIMAKGPATWTEGVKPLSHGPFTIVPEMPAIWTEGVKPTALAPWTEGVKPTSHSPWTETTPPSATWTEGEKIAATGKPAPSAPWTESGI